MILALDTYASYLYEHSGKIRAAIYMLLTKENEPDFHNCAILIFSRIIKHVMSSAYEAEIWALYHGCKSAIPFQTTLEELVHSQERPTKVTTDNSTAHGLTLDTMVSKSSKSNDMCLRWSKCRGTQQLFSFLWARGYNNRSDYPNEDHSPNITHTCTHDM